MTLDEKIAWRDECDRILREKGFVPWWEIPSRVEAKKLRGPSSSRAKDGCYRVAYRLREWRVILVIPEEYVPEYSNQRVRWLFGNARLLRRGEGAPYLALTLEHIDNLDESEA